MKLVETLKTNHRNFWITLFVMVTASPTWAAGPNNLGELADQGGTFSGSLLDGVLQMCGLVGFVFFVINGIKLLSEKNNQQESAAKTWKGLAAGIFLMAPFTFQALFFNSTLADTKSAADIRKVISGS